MKRAFVFLLCAIGCVALVIAAAPDAPAGGAAPSKAPTATPAPSPAPKTATPRYVVVFCAPGYPGTTVQAQPTMDAFARALEKAAGWPAGHLGAVYYESEGGGLERLKKDDAAVAVTTLPFFFQNADKSSLTPRLLAEQRGATTERWSLVAHKERVKRPADLDGWELAGPAGYAPDLVRAMLKDWGELPATTKIKYAPAPMGSMRRAVEGENVAVLMEPEQIEAIFPSHPFAQDLEVVTASSPVPGSVVSVVTGHIGEADAEKMLDGLARLPSIPEGVESLKTLKVDKFVPTPPKALAGMKRTSSAR